MGWVMYPAAHLYHYVGFLHIHNNFDNSLQIVRYIYGLLHTVVLALVVDMSYIYYPELDAKKADGVDLSRSSRAQMIAFTFMAWIGERTFQIDLYND